MVVKSVFIFATDKASIFSENGKNALVEEYKNTLYLKRFYVLYKLSCLILDSFKTHFDLVVSRSVKFKKSNILFFLNF